MRIINILLIIFLLSSSGYSQNIELNFDSIYSGGFDSLKNNLTKRILNSASDVRHDYFIFFEITVEKNNSIHVKELYRKPDVISAIVGKEIEATFTKWEKTESNIILPIFLILDRESNPQSSKTYTFTQRDYPLTNKIVRGFLMPPIVINYFHQN